MLARCVPRTPPIAIVVLLLGILCWSVGDANSLGVYDRILDARAAGESLRDVFVEQWFGITTTALFPGGFAAVITGVWFVRRRRRRHCAAVLDLKLRTPAKRSAEALESDLVMWALCRGVRDRGMFDVAGYVRRCEQLSIERRSWFDLSGASSPVKTGETGEPTAEEMCLTELPIGRSFRYSLVVTAWMLFLPAFLTYPDLLIGMRLGSLDGHLPGILLLTLLIGIVVLRYSSLKPIGLSSVTAIPGEVRATGPFRNRRYHSDEDVILVVRRNRFFSVVILAGDGKRPTWVIMPTVNLPALRARWCG